MLCLPYNALFLEEEKYDFIKMHSLGVGLHV